MCVTFFSDTCISIPINKLREKAISRTEGVFFISESINDKLILTILQIASPSIDSFSTLPDQELSDFQTDSRDLQVKVDNPQKHLESLETYITFRITTRVGTIIVHLTI